MRYPSFKRNSKRVSLTQSALLLTLMAACAGEVAAATFQSLAQRLPAETNAVVAVNVGKLLSSPYGKQQGWANDMADSWAKRAQLVPPGVSLLLMGADWDPGNADTTWQVNLMQMEKMPALQQLAKAEGGYIDRLSDKDSVLSLLNNAYFVPIEPQVLAALTPADRRATIRWISQPAKPEGYITSGHIKGALATLREDTVVMMALDLEGAFPLPRIRRFLANVESEALKDKDLDALTNVIGTLQGITVNITVDKEITGRLAIRFGKEVTALGDAAKPLLIAVLDKAGMHLDDVDQWTFTAGPKEVTATGKLSEASLRRLLAVVQSTAPAVASAPSTPQDQPAASDSASASQHYFKAVCLTLDSFPQNVSLAAYSTWFLRSAKQIDKLPILDVDPSLVEWGATVSMKFKEVAGVAAAGRSQATARSQGVLNSESGSYDNSGYYQSTNRTVQNANVRRQRAQAEAEQRAQTQQEGQRILSGINGSRQKVRAEMTAKYKIEF